MRFTIGCIVVLFGLIAVQSAPADRLKRQFSPEVEEILRNDEGEIEKLVIEMNTLVTQNLTPEELESFLIESTTFALNQNEVPDDPYESLDFIGQLYVKYFSSKPDVLARLQEIEEKMMEATLAAAGFSLKKRDVDEQSPLEYLDKVATAYPELATYISSFKVKLAQLRNLLSAEQLNKLEQRIRPILERFTSGKIQIDQFKVRLHELVQNLNNIDKSQLLEIFKNILGQLHQN